MATSTYVKGLEGVIAAQTALSLVDGTESQLYYRGIPIHELVKGSHVEETIYLLWHGKLPSAADLKTFTKNLSGKRDLPDKILSILKSFPKKAHPMGMLRTMTSLLGLFDENEADMSPENLIRKSLRLTAVFPTFISAFYRIREGKKVIAPDRSLSHAANFLYMLNGQVPTPEMEKALDAYLILLADHGLNASTFAARVTASTQSDLYSAVTAAIGTLKGDLHGSANQRAMEMILEVGAPSKAEAYVENLLIQKKKVMGFGHRIYKKRDPRAEAFREIAQKMCERSGERKWMDISNIIEKVMMEKKQIPCNVDFFSAPVLYILGFPVDFFTTVFAASRVVGWTAQVMEQHQNNRLIRPAAEYVGPRNQHYIPIEKRT